MGVEYRRFKGYGKGRGRLGVRFYDDRDDYRGRRDSFLRDRDFRDFDDDDRFFRRSGKGYSRGLRRVIDYGWSRRYGSKGWGRGKGFRKGKGKGKGFGRFRKGKGKGKGKRSIEMLQKKLDQELDEFMGPEVAKERLDLELKTYFGEPEKALIV